MTIKIPCSKEEKFRTIIEILSSAILQLKELRPRERDVLSQYYYYNYLHKDLPSEYRDSITFSTTVRDKVCEKLEISKDNLYNIMLDLRKYGFLTESGFGKNIIPDLDSITFTFIDN